MGSENHPEVVGIRGWSCNDSTVIENIDFDNIKLQFDNFDIDNARLEFKNWIESKNNNE